MSKTVTLPNPATGGVTGLLVTMIITFLAPMFLADSGGDIAIARMAAAQTLNVYCARNDEEMISIVQIIAFGFAALMSLSRAMEDDVSVVMMLRLHGNANACNRSAEHNRRALRDSRARVIVAPAPVVPDVPDDDYDQTELNAVVASALERTGQAAPAQQAPVQPVETPAPEAPVATPIFSAAVTNAAEAVASPNAAVMPALSVTATAERQNQVTWATGMALVAAQYAADLPNLSPRERSENAVWAEALSTCAHELMDGKAAPRPRPGDLDGLIGRPAAQS